MWAQDEDFISNIENAHKSHQVCGAHFQNKMFVDSNMDNACPKLFPIQEGTSTTSISEEHNSCKIENLPVIGDTNSHEIRKEIIVTDHHKLEYIHNLQIQEEMSYRSIHNCDECGYESKSTFFMLNHVRRHFLPSQLFDCAINIEMYHCKNCAINFDCIVHLRNHIEEQHSTLATRSAQQIIEHVETDISSNTNIVEMKNKQFRCGKCTYKTTRKCDFNRHVMSRHSDDKDKRWFYCTMCTYKTTQNHHLRSHKTAKHTDDKDKKWFECEKCTYKATRNINLYKHVMRRHSDDKDKRLFYCTMCTYKTTQNHHLTSHIIAKHTDDKDKKWFCCEKCTYKTIRKKNLNKHVMRRHSDDKDKRWFNCDKCTYKATRKEHLTLHIMAKHTHDKDKKWFYCERCTYRTIRKEHLNTHIKTKHISDKDKKWFNCEKCIYKTKWKHDLERHNMAKHTDS